MKIRRIYILLFVMVFHGLQSFGALNPPSLRCLDVKANGDVELTWVIPADPTAIFDSYQIYYSSAQAGPFSLLTTISVYAQTSFLHVGANAQTQARFYYLVTVSNAPTYQYSTPSDTLSTMRLTALSPLNGTAPLSWNALHIPALTTSGNYGVYYEYPAGVWNAAGTTTSTSFLDTIDICSSQINFRTEQPDASGCISVSAIDGDIYQNIIPPDIPELDSVSVDPVTQNAILGWKPSSSGDTEGYIIYLFTGVWTHIDTVWGITTNFYEYLTSTADNNAESYCIAAIDSCGITSPLTSGHTTIFLNSTVDPCTRSVQLNWSPYLGFASGVDEYIIYISENGGVFSVLDHITPTTLAYNVNNLHDGSVYCFSISALAVSGDTSSSNYSCRLVDFPDIPAYVYIRYASVNTNNNVVLKWVNDNTVSVLGYSLQRATDPNGFWTSIDYKTYSGQPEYTFTDMFVSANQKSAYYRVAVIDNCGNEVLYSDTARTIFLGGDPLNDLTNELIWNDYEGWPANAMEYRLYRMIDRVPDTSPCATFVPGVGYFIDDVSPFYLSYGLFTYRLQAIEAVGNPLGYTDTTWSNSIEIQQLPRLFIANAFSPTGYNKTFCPLGVYIDHNTYSFIVFNEMGEEMFKTTDFFECWDGTNDGEQAPMGVYHYVLHLTLPDNQQFLKQGPITLIR